MKKLLLVCYLMVSSVAPAAAMLIRDFQPFRHERYYSGNDRSFIGESYDFSGVGTEAGGAWATLISDSYFISAAHFHPALQSSVTFHETNSVAGPAHAYTVAGGQQIGSTDLWVGWFDAVVDPSIARYPILSLSMPSDYLGLVQYDYGTGHRVGLNVTEASSTATVGPSTGMVWLADYDNNDSPSVDGDETLLQVGDSGSPTFNLAFGHLALIGIHWAVSDQFAGTDEGEKFADSSVPASITGINAVLDDRNQALTIIPEPASALYFGSGAALLAGTGRRTRRVRGALRRPPASSEGITSSGQGCSAPAELPWISDQSVTTSGRIVSRAPSRAPGLFYAMIPFTTCPATSVSRKSRPSWRKVSFS